MKYFFILFASAILFSCNNADQQKENTGKAATDSSSAKDVDSNDFTKLVTTVPFAGVWVNETYVNDIKKTKSPRSSQNINASCIVIPSKTLKETRMINGFHEGSEDWAIVKKGDGFQFYNSGLTKLARKIDVISPDKIKIGDQTFILMKHGDPNKSNFNILEEILFSGQFQSASGNKVSFTTNGQVTGLDTLNYYNAVIDYGDMASDVNQIELGQTKKSLHRYGFQFDKEDLLIYNLKCTGKVDGVCESVAFGKLAYKLTRVH
ncbi:MAG: hypothetical protein ABI480_16020 [Chitinophagaceae bacterium]